MTTDWIADTARYVPAHIKDKHTPFNAAYLPLAMAAKANPPAPRKPRNHTGRAVLKAIPSTNISTVTAAGMTTRAAI